MQSGEASLVSSCFLSFFLPSSLFHFLSAPNSLSLPLSAPLLLRFPSLLSRKLLFRFKRKSCFPVKTQSYLDLSVACIASVYCSCSLLKACSWPWGPLFIISLTKGSYVLSPSAQWSGQPSSISSVSYLQPALVGRSKLIYQRDIAIALPLHHHPQQPAGNTVDVDSWKRAHCTMERSSTLHKEELGYAAKWMSFADLVLGEMSQSQEDKTSRTASIGGIWNSRVCTLCECNSGYQKLEREELGRYWWTGNTFQLVEIAKLWISAVQDRT